ncbi:valine--tRNA ligase [Candidatus Microgenomates bacterium]|nr:valine--tRNA ligase [Candidatus Microgenomates bacterium]
MMDKIYQPKTAEEKWYKFWEEGGYFKPNEKNKKPFTIVLPPPNANAPLHMGHAMYAVEDIMIRYHRMLGDSTLWLPGADHAGIETQYVFEKQLAKEGKGRFDFSREQLYQMIWDFVQQNRSTMENQLRRLGFSLDWSRLMFTLDPKIVKIVYQTFKKLYDEGFIYRGQRLVNYCTKCGTGFSELEVNYVERNDPLYYLKYGPFTIATVRPETKFRDTALAVNPKDKRYQKYLGKTLEIPGLLGNIKMMVIADPEVDPKFGTGIMKVTPAHDPHDFELGKKYNLPITPIIDFNGRMNFSWYLSQKKTPKKYKQRAEKYHGKKVAEARKLMVEDLKEDGLLLKVDENYSHRIGTCYKTGTVLEPLPMEQWFMKIPELSKTALNAINKGKIKFQPQRFKKTALDWLKNFHDWNIGRQIVWGIRIPAWKCQNCQRWIITAGEIPRDCPNCQNTNLVQDPDTFDTWFSSGQWPFATLKSTRPGDFEKFYPTSVMETGYDILPWWVCRMIIFGLYVTKKVPFSTVYLHGIVRDSKGQKMSKSKGNVVNPMELVEKYGADALRFSLIYGTKAGADQNLSEDKVRAMRNFANKLWNIARFIELNIQGQKIEFIESKKKFSSFGKETKECTWCYETLNEALSMAKTITKQMEQYKFGQAAESIYAYTWHKYADLRLEAAKKMLQENLSDTPYVRGTLLIVLEKILRLLHPFMPFVTEEIWSEMKQYFANQPQNPLIVESWPK